MINYTVKIGDSLWTIAKKFLGDGNRYKEIQKVNGLKTTVIKSGQVLKIPSDSKLDYEQIGRAFEKALSDIDNIDSVNKLYKLLGD